MAAPRQFSSRTTSLNKQNPPLQRPSKHLLGDCDKTLVAHRETSSTSTATIPASDFTSFTTDYQPSWSSTPLTQAASAHNQHNFEQDFQLFSSPRPATHPRPSREQAIHRILPNQTQALLRHPIPVSQRPLQQPTIGYRNSPNNYRSLTNPNAQLLQIQRTIARHNQNKVRPPVPKFNEQSTPHPQHRNSAPGSTQAFDDMSLFDHIDFQGGFQGDTSLDFFEAPFDGNFVANSPHQAHPATISPTELFNDEAIMSNSASTAFPNLATPGSEYLDSPDFTSSGLNTTPMLDGALDSELDMTKLETMPSLFPDMHYDQFDPEPAIVPSNSFGSLHELSVHEASSVPPMVRQKSSPGRPPIVHDRKASLSAGITKANQKSRKELPDIVIESEDDKETAKRKKNTAAARKSRQRKQETVGAMAAEISRLRGIIAALGGDPELEYD